MLALDDKRWMELLGGYRLPFDPRNAFQKLESSTNVKKVWHELWEQFYHQGDVGELSYAAVPHLVRIHRRRGVVDWNTYAIAATIELARDIEGNPELPDWLRDGYEEALRELAKLGLAELPHAEDEETVRSILALLAITKGARTYGRLLIEFTEDELLELERQAFGDLDIANL